MIKLPRHHQPLRGPLDMAPLIDVVLLLLIFFMLSSTFVLQPGIRVDPPRSLYGSPGAPSNTSIVTVMLEAEKRDPATGNPLPRQPVIFFNDQILSLPDLEKALSQLNRKHSGAPLVLKADKEVPLGLVTEIMNAAMAGGMSVVIATQQANGPSQ